MSVRDREEMVVARLQALAPHLDGEPDPAFRAATRARLVAMAAVRSPAPEPVAGLKRLLAARPEDAVRPRWRTRLTASLAGAALTVTAAASLVALADGARPGDVLYGLKRGTEQAQLALAGDARGTTLLGFASTRLDELRELVDAPSARPAGADPELVISTLETMDDQTTEGTAWLTDRAVTSAAETPVDELSDWVVSQSDGLAALAPQLPDAAGAAVSHSLTLLSDVATRADALLVALNCPAGPAVGASDPLGPTPAPCVPAAAQTPDGSTGGTAPGTGATGTAPSAGLVPTPSGSVGGGDTGSGGLTVPASPTVPGLPKVTVPTVPGGLPTSLGVPTSPLPRSPAGAPASGSLGVCLPPLPKIGDC